MDIWFKVMEIHRSKCVRILILGQHVIIGQLAINFKNPADVCRSCSVMNKVVDTLEMYPQVMKNYDIWTKCCANS